MDHSTPVHERRETHGAQFAEAYFSKMTLLVPAEGGAQNCFCQPAVEPAQLAFVVHVLEVVVEDRDIANAFFYDFGRQTSRSLLQRRLRRNAKRNRFWILRSLSRDSATSPPMRRSNPK